MGDTADAQLGPSPEGATLRSMARLGTPVEQFKFAPLPQSDCMAVRLFVFWLVLRTPVAAGRYLSQE